jgi:uncharacterized protein (TIGR00156 family)
MSPRRAFLGVALCAALALPALAQFTGPGAQGTTGTVADAQDARPGSYITLEGSIVAHLREDYYRFADDTGEIRVEIPAETFAGRQVGPETRLRLRGEVDMGVRGRYVWVESLTIL